ncbi:MULTISPECIES: septation protein IspZ [unclassified Rhizobium]|nr:MULTISPECIES: septation protein IspZ [unclassified Rhizobium]TQX89410.1 intracellular septation protein [Rhizobium sp. rho-13.1]TQY15414.1 intracellular septation protein [Rhizobium sp. rho-1.1]
MKSFLKTIGLMANDLGASLLFVILFSLTQNAVLSACLGMLFGACQIAVQVSRRKPVDSMQWLSLFLVFASGTATMVTDDPRFVLFKPSVIYVIVGAAMLKPGWINRYLPAIARAVSADIGIALGFVWSGLMFTTAALNAYLALSTEIKTWALTMAIFTISSKVLLVLAGFAAIRLVTQSRLRAMPAKQRESLLVTTGWNTKSPVPASR